MYRRDDGKSWLLGLLCATVLAAIHLSLSYLASTIEMFSMQ